MPSLARPAFPDDDGSADPQLSEALDAFASSRDLVDVLPVLADARLIVPVVALLGDVPSAGDKEADMAAVLMTGADGRTALLAFSSLPAMTRWQSDARPVPVPARQACAAAVAERAAALVVDIAGPVTVVVEAADLAHLAEGDVLVRAGDGFGWVRGGQ